VPNVVDAFGPVEWSVVKSPEGPVVPGVWSKTLRRPGNDEQSLVLVRFDVGASHPVHVHNQPQQVLILEGSLEDHVTGEGGGEQSYLHYRGAFVEYPAGAKHRQLSPSGCLLLLTL